jgi:hypothetical protein
MLCMRGETLGAAAVAEEDQRLLLGDLFGLVEVHAAAR